MPRYRGGCLCRAVRYSAEAEPINERVCHCRLCQKALGASFNARILFKAEEVRFEGEPRRYMSSPDLERGFCGTCGTTIYSRRPSNGVMGLTVGSLDDPSLFRPQMHFWTGSRQPWLHLDDGLPQHPGAPG